MDGPGMSLFNGAGSIHLNTSSQRLEEEEALEEEKRRTEELKNELHNRLDDYVDDEDDSVNDSSHFVSMNQSQRNRTSINDKGPLNLQAELMQTEKNESRRVSEQTPRSGIAGTRPTPLGLQHHNAYNGMKKQHSDDQPTNSGHRQYQDFGLSDHFQHCYQKPANEAYENLRHVSGGTTNIMDYTPVDIRQNDEQLQILFEMKVREVQRLSEELAVCRKDAAASHDALYGRLAVAEAERERAQLSLQQSQELVANSKHRITELEHQVSSLNKKVAMLNVKNEELNAEITATTASLMDTQRRLQAAKLNKESAQNTDALFKAQQERYKEDTDRLEKDLMRTRNKLQDKENECLAMEKRFLDLERTKENILIDKGATINRLAMELEEAQNRLASTDTSELKEKLNHLINERNMARLQIKDMAGKLEATATDLVEYRTKYIRLQEEQSEMEAVLTELTECEEANSFLQLQPNKPVRGFSVHADKVVILRNELIKNISAQKLKMEQIDKLNKTLQQKDQLIETFKDAEVRIKKEVDLYKERHQQKSEELRSIVGKFETYKSTCNVEMLDRLNTKCSDLENELKHTKMELNSLSSKHSSLEVKYEELCSDQNHRNSLERLSNGEISKERDRLTHQLNDARKQVDEFKNLYVEVCGAKDKLTKELNEFKTTDSYVELKKERARVEEYKQLLELEKTKVERFQKNLLELQKKEFEEELKNYKKKADASEGTEKEDFKRIELLQQLKEENQKLLEICEEQKHKLNELIKELDESKNSIKKLKMEIELQGERDRLIEDLKEKGKQFEQYILNQKSKLMNKRDACTSPQPDLYKNLISEQVQTSILAEENKTSPVKVDTKIEEIVRDEIAQHFAIEIKKAEHEYKKKICAIEEKYNDNIEQLATVLKVKTREVSSLQEVVIAERSRMKELLSNFHECEQSNANKEKMLIDYKENLEQCKKHITRLNTEMQNLRKQSEKATNINEIKSKYETRLKEFERLKDKYKILKKTAIKYKEYIVEKDKHIDNEVQRIKGNYESSIHTLQEKLDACLRDMDEKAKQRYTEKLELNMKTTLKEQIS